MVVLLSRWEHAIWNGQGTQKFCFTTSKTICLQFSWHRQKLCTRHYRHPSQIETLHWHPFIGVWSNKSHCQHFSLFKRQLHLVAVVSSMKNVKVPWQGQLSMNFLASHNPDKDAEKKVILNCWLTGSWCCCQGPRDVANPHPSQEATMEQRPPPAWSPSWFPHWWHCRGQKNLQTFLPKKSGERKEYV